MVGPTGDDFQDFCTMVGMMSLTWAWAENALALSIGIIDESVPQLRNHTELPVSTKRRIKYLRQALADIPQLEPLKQIGTVLADDFAQLRVSRNELIHGAAWQLEDTHFQSLTLKISGRQQAAQKKSLSIQQAILLNVQITKLSDDAATFLIRVREIFPSAPGAVQG